MSLWLSVLVALVGLVVVARFSVPPLLRRFIKARLGGYQREACVVDPSLPEALSSPKRAAIVGAGVAGLTAAVTLARRGFSVTLFEAQSYLGGKLGSFPVELAPGKAVWVSHGFHAFFPHYHNLNRFLDSLGVRRGWKSIGDYVIIGRDREIIRFGDIETTPALNLLGLSRAGVYPLSDALKAPGRDLYGLFLEYEHDRTFEALDHLSFRRFDEVAQVPPRLKLAFDTFARAFFAEDDKLSLAELLKSFHFYYLSHDGGLIYDYPDRDYEPSVLAPLRAELERHGATIHLSTPVKSLAVSEGGFAVNGERFDKVIVSTDVVGANAILTRAEGVPEPLRARFAKLGPGQRYAVLRLYTDREPRADIPVFVITDREQVLDAVAVYHRLEQESAAYVREHGGAVLELHCYAVPDAMSEAEVRQALIDELQRFFPELVGMVIHHEHYQLNRNFTAFHVGMYQDRPEVESGVPGLHFAGDWVKLPFAAMLLEAACSSGLWAANAVLREEGLRLERVISVPQKGLMEAFCGFYVSGADAKLYNNATQVVLMREGTRTVLSMANNYQGPPRTSRWCPGAGRPPEGERQDPPRRDLRARRSALRAAPRRVLGAGPLPQPCATTRDWDKGAEAIGPMAEAAATAGRRAAPGVVEAEFAVGEYEIVILSADDSAALDTWLRQNAYKIPEGAEPVLRPYVQPDRSSSWPRSTARRSASKGAWPSSRRCASTTTRSLQLPVRLGLLNSRGVQDLIVHILAQAASATRLANYPNVTIPTNLELGEAALSSFGAFYVALFDKAVEKQPGAVVTEYAWSAGSCDPCPGPTLSEGDLRSSAATIMRRKRLDPAQGRQTRCGPQRTDRTCSKGRYVIRHRWKGDITCPDPHLRPLGRQSRRRGRRARSRLRPARRDAPRLLPRGGRALARPARRRCPRSRGGRTSRSWLMCGAMCFTARWPSGSACSWASACSSRCAGARGGLRERQGARSGARGRAFCARRRGRGPA
jgi:isorenieratene synthase